ncbi:hypothetical protein Tco_1431487, partial [Tanacetum coccineum]
FNRIRHAVENLQTQTLRRSIKRPSADLDQPTSKKSKSNVAQHTSVPPASNPSTADATFTTGVSSTKPSDVAPFAATSHTEVPPDVPQMSSAAVPPTATPPSSNFSTPPTVLSVEPTTHSYGTRRRSLGVRKKQLGRKGVHTSHSAIPVEDNDPEAELKVCIKYASDEDSSSDDDTSVNLYPVVDWELLPTGLGWINVIYRKDNSRKYFTSLREILHLVSRADLMTIYGRVVTYYQDKPAEGVGLILWGDLKVLIDSLEINDIGDMWKYQHTWSIQSWKLYPYSGVHVLETVDGLALHMFVDKKYPLTVNLIERMLEHQLEIGRQQEGNALTTAVQLIAFLKKQISDSRRPNRLASPRVNGYLVKASSNPFTFYDSPLPGVNTPWDVMRIVCNPELMDVAEVVQFPTGRYVVPTGRVIATVSIKVPTGRYIVPAGYIISPGRVT